MSEADGRETRYSDPDDVRGPLWEAAVAAGVVRGAIVPAGDEADESPLAPEDVDGNLRRYLRWQARDWVRQRGVWIAAAVLGVLLMTWLSYDPVTAERLYHSQLASAAEMAARSPSYRTWVVQTPAERLSQTFLALASLFSVLGSVAATFGIVARDRERGLQRFLFAKPVRVAPYYLQKLAVAAAGYLVIALAGALLASLLFGAVLPVGTALAVAVGVFATLGALTFLLSTLTRFDGAGAIAALVVAYMAFIIAGQQTGGYPVWAAVARAVRWGLPPVPTVEVFSPMYANVPHMSVAFAITWLVAYAVAAVLAALAVLRRRSIST